eukprot:CAMPEP_0203667274 /NCGR_PEP_ID=MMETSP0090-20130426/4152_1 /ASSEMBLY_ACC=CAM_ASM_001088 /TAXON_ID=426623 /ORGANISM="Chaetoceros affinis, Strain CCMP159" /LENGTH=676 /DNA_ID=CAMNT_0050531393 /DNA_START=55 /DNA_END=2082 /DNA_ORIENTATION=-
MANRSKKSLTDDGGSGNGDIESDLLRKSKKKSKKDKKKKDKKARKDRSIESENDDGENQSSDQMGNDASITMDSSQDEHNGHDGAAKEKLSKKEKKRLKKEKKKKRKRDEYNNSGDASGGGDDNHDTNNSNNKNHSNSSSKKKKKRKKNSAEAPEEQEGVQILDPKPQDITAAPNKDDLEIVGGRIISYSASIVNEIDVEKQKKNEKKVSNHELEEEGGKGDCASTIKAGHSDSGNGIGGCTLLLFYQYIEPVLDENEFQSLFNHIETTGEQYSICGRARVATEGVNCTLTGSYDNIRQWCKSLRSYAGAEVGGSGTETETGRKYFANTEFKLTDDLPLGQAFKNFHAFRVDEIVNYGLAGERAPAVSMSGVHLEPKDYHKKMTEDNTVIIDVRNHYEAAIGKFNPPMGGAQYIDPLMRKSTEFPVWLDKPETKKILKGKQVLMYCTGGIRCERASALLRTKIEHEEDTKQLGIKGVYQLQGGIDKYFREFPEGGWWKGKNYVFDKRFAHAPPVVENLERQQKSGEVLGKCGACHKPWDRYRGKKRCPTCGVPLLICKECHNADKQKTKKIDKNVKCDLCVKEGITSKRELRDKEKKEMAAYEKMLREKYGFKEINPKKSSSTGIHSSVTNKPMKKAKIVPNPNKITRLFIKNLNIREIDQPQLCELVEGITHIEW